MSRHDLWVARLFAAAAVGCVLAVPLLVAFTGYGWRVPAAYGLFGLLCALVSRWVLTAALVSARRRRALRRAAALSWDYQGGDGPS